MRLKILAATAALALGLPVAVNAAPAPRFLQDAVSGDNGEVAVGRLAQQRGASAGVRNFGRTLERDHAMAKAQALATARRLRITVAPGAIKPEAAQTRRQLMRLRGPAFDRAFVGAMVSDHRKDIAKFELQARTGDRTTAALARTTLPHLRHHLDLALRLQRGSR